MHLKEIHYLVKFLPVLLPPILSFLSSLLGRSVKDDRAAQVLSRIDIHIRYPDVYFFCFYHG